MEKIHRFLYKSYSFPHTVDMEEKVKVYENEGRTREERESCFPISKSDKTQGVDTK